MKKHILIIEDDRMVAEMLISALETQGYTVTWVESSTRAAEVLTTTLTRNTLSQAQPEQRGSDVTNGNEHHPLPQPDLILLDLTLDGMSGADVIRQAAQTTEELPPVIVVSGVAQPEIARVASSIQASCIVQKPFSIPRLLRNIAQVMEQQQ
jgi:CheY-like chemotaxis protein